MEKKWPASANARLAKLFAQKEIKKDEKPSNAFYRFSFDKESDLSNFRTAFNKLKQKTPVVGNNNVFNVFYCFLLSDNFVNAGDDLPLFASSGEEPAPKRGYAIDAELIPDNVTPDIQGNHIPISVSTYVDNLESGQQKMSIVFALPSVAEVLDASSVHISDDGSKITIDYRLSTDFMNIADDIQKLDRLHNDSIKILSIKKAIHETGKEATVKISLPFQVSRKFKLCIFPKSPGINIYVIYLEQPLSTGYGEAVTVN